MRRRRWIPAILLVAAALPLTVRVRYVRLGWGGYWEVGFECPVKYFSRNKAK
jgi:hypothetical protein